MLNPSLLSEARERAARLLDLERDAEHAKADYHHALRRLHLEGGSFREIGSALGLSHQRVAQVVSAGSRSWLERWRRTQDERLACTFCGRSDREVEKLVAGPGVYICDGCIEGVEHARQTGEPVHSPTLLTPDLSGSRLRCSFCCKREPGGRTLVGVASARICGACTELASSCARGARTSRTLSPPS